jgi:hypothetical protein
VFEERSAAAGRVGNNARQRITRPKAARRRIRVNEDFIATAIANTQAERTVPGYSILNGMFSAGPF